jgi:glycerol-3-phosphate O-acyltransferase
MTSGRTVAEAENRLERFNGERDRIIATVEDRVVARLVERASHGEDRSLEYVLNDVAYTEIRRLEKGSGKSRDRQLERWRSLALQLGRLSENEKQRELRSLVHHYSAEVAGNFNPKVYRFANDVLPPALSLLFSPIRSVREGYRALGELSGRIQCEGPIELIRSVCDKGTLVVTPTHTSNLDSIALGFGLKMCSLPPVTYGAGKNLFSNPLISFFMHNLGAYKVDRRLKFALYKDVLKEYSTVLLERGYHSLFFPGGTRCRSNRVEQHLKLGLLGTAQAAYQNALRSDAARGRIYVVPVTINYRLVLEAETLVEDFLEEEGKSRYIIVDDEFSRVGRVVEFLRKLFALEGAVVLRFGRPLDLVGNTVDDEGMSIDARGRKVDFSTYYCGADGEVVSDPQRDREYTSALGDSVAKAFRAETVVLSNHLVARAVYDEIVKRSGTRDVYRLLRLPSSSVSAEVPAVLARVDALRQRIADNPESGKLHSSTTGRTAAELLDEALESLCLYHHNDVVLRMGDRIRVGDMKLLHYYRNRIEHVGGDDD